ncbi:sensor histidine kinase [Aestuariibaculum sediminum]|uniref:Histidine kinase n=1 Tax=Aestuariibaculum sediminum TaxID=2770637 RepID=A0A8J6Q1X5_9FLAO|nr:histidine kinase [Aestuariibaculum sediminum]MBD0831401.1 histidine kinase [Aestuariibaculum sediminum]
MLQTTELNIMLITSVFIILGIIMALVILFSVFMSKKNTLIQEQLETKLANQKRQYELQLNALRAQMNPHFVHNSLNAIQYYIQLNDVEKSEDYLAQFSKLMRLFFEYSRKQHISLENEIHSLKSYLEIEKLRFEDKFDFQFQIDSDLDTQDLFLPPMILQPLVENAINHGIFHNQTRGQLWINFKLTEAQNFQIEIIDNGIGINAARKRFKSKLEQHTEHSGYVLEERLGLLKESNSWHIDFTILDRQETENTNGTKVILTFFTEKTLSHDH